MCGGPDIEAPKPTPEEIALQREQLELLREQRALQRALLPYYLEQAGLIPVTEYREIWYNTRTGKEVPEIQAQLIIASHGGKPPSWLVKKKVPTGEMQFRPMTEEERLARMSEAERMAYENYKAMLERQRKALAGELPVSPALEREIEEQRKRLEEELSARLGPNWRLTTPGQQAWSEFQKRAELLREEARRGQIGTGTGLLLSQAGYLTNLPVTRTALYSRPIATYGGLLAQYERAQEPYRRQRMLEYQADLQSALMGSQRTAGLLGGLFTLAGIGLGGWMYGRGRAGRGLIPYSPAGLWYRW